MTKKEYPKNELFEKLADIEHQRWADWQSWCHKVLRENCPSVELEKVLERWDKQIATDYNDLSEKEKDSDRDQVMRYFNLILEEIEKEMPDRMGPDEIKSITRHIEAKNDKDRESLANERVYGFNFCLYMMKALINDLKK